ncbi:cupin domain-containing protein [Actinacidiphila oryziradicis]|uniref:Cupin n=1 Tax=Actinacidiphila oryziradicis TaxID=2571141 RepID=A0A4U0RQZ6_9ACTN|nr:cupin domain-containing protein [Actinacidiphila oryziradicis]TJZ98421.1 cupin [Actinacidiphila oryziradicis]
MTTVSIAECLGEDFLAQALHRTYRHVPRVLPAAAGLMTWDDLNTILSVQRLEPPRLRLSVDGEALPQHRYSVPVTTRRHQVWHRIHPAEFHARLAEGASLVLDAVDELHPPIGRLAQELEGWLRTGVQVNLYASWTSTEGFGTHWDDHDVIVVQLEGAKRWRLYGPTRAAPMYRDTATPEPPPEIPVAELVMQAGDVLYLPRGWWHSVTADQGTHSLHLTCGLQTHTGADLMGWLSETLRASERVRADLPRFAEPHEQAAYVEALRKELLAELEDPAALLARYTVARDATDAGRMRTSLPHLAGPPADPVLPVQLTTGRACLTETKASVTFTANGQEWDFAPKVGPLLRRLLNGGPATLADLAEASGLTVEQAATVVGELVSGQAAALGTAEPS